MFSTPAHKQAAVMRTDFPERRATPDLNARTLVGIRAAIECYYMDLNARKHGGMAQSHAFSKIEQMLGMSWNDYPVKPTKTKEQ